MLLLDGEPAGLGIDFTTLDGLGSVAVKGHTTNLNNVPVDSFLTNSGTSPKLVRNAAGTYVWSAHNLFLNSGVPATQNVTLIVGATYTYDIVGSGSLAGSSGASGTATEGNPVTFVATGTTGTFTLTGSGTRIQINRGSILTAYLASGASARFAVPIDYDGGFFGLVEPAATNLVPNNWSGTWGTANLQFLYHGGMALPASTVIAVSAWVKRISASPFDLKPYHYNNGSPVFGTAQQPGTSWARLVFTFTTGAHASSDGGWIFPGNGESSSSFVEDATCPIDGAIRQFTDSLGNSVYIAGSQFETGAIATSPIPTFGATVTRAADADNSVLTAIPFSATLGTIYLKGRTPKAAAAAVLASLDDGTANERIRITYTGTNIVIVITDGGSGVASIDLGAVAVDTAYQVTLAWAANDVAASLDGAAIVADTSVTLPTVTTLRIGYSPAGEQGVTRFDKIVYVPRRVADADLPTWRYAA